MIKYERMSKVMDIYTNYIYKELSKNPINARRWILRAYRLFGFYQKYFPDKEMPKSKQYLANASMGFMLKGFSRPEEAALVSLFMPCEILQAFDIPVMCAEMFSTYLNGAGVERGFVEYAENKGISETYCSYHKILMGAAKANVLPPTKYIINCSLACDANNLTFRTLSHLTGSPQYYLDVPYKQNDISVEHVAKQLKELVNILEEMTGKRLDENKLIKIVERSKRTIANLNKTILYRKDKYLPMTLTSELYEALMVHNGLGTKEALKYSELLLDDYKHAKNNTGLKIVWMHSNPFWQSAAKNLLNKKEDVHIVATDMGYDAWYESTTNDPYRYMAERLVYDAYNGPIQHRINKTIEMVKKTEADGVVCFCHWGCKETCGASNIIKTTLERENIPTLILNGDGVDRNNASDGQTSTRLGAFIEMLKELSK